MKSILPQLCLALLLVGITLIASSCSREEPYMKGSTTITVVNDSAATLTKITVDGAGFSVPISSLVPGGEQELKVTPSGDSGLTVSFEVDGEARPGTYTGYFEPGAAVKATIHADFSVTVDAKL